MKEQKESLEAISDIRKMMVESSKFISLSGLSGVFAGIYALSGALVGNLLVNQYISDKLLFGFFENTYQHVLILGMAICFKILILSVLTALFLSARKARKKGLKLIDHTSKKLLVSMSVPLLTGGIFCFALLYHGSSFILLICPVMLIFYGISLVSAAKYTYHDVIYLGYMQISLGLISCFLVGYGILFWAFGFGVLHIVYGAYMWYKYDLKH